MALVRGPRIVRNGLVLHLDAAQRTSYSGSGTTWADLTSNKFNGSLINTPLFNYSNGGYFSLNGTSQWIDLGNKTGLQTSQITVSAWFNRTNAAITGHETIVEQDKGPWISWLLAITSTGLGWNIGYTNSPPYSTGIDAVGNYLDGLWHNVVGTYDLQNLRIYVDGVEKNSSAFTTAILYSSAKFQIGFHYESTTYFEGKIATTSLYNRALTATEILQNYNATKGRFNL